MVNLITKQEAQILIDLYEKKIANGNLTQDEKDELEKRIYWLKRI